MSKQNLTREPDRARKTNSARAQLAEEIKGRLAEAWLPNIYARILEMRTRSYQLGTAARSVSIQHTLLGVELKLGGRRLLCPDLATARYLSVFARAGCAAVAVPYDITRISHLADELDSSWHRMLLMADQATAKEGTTAAAAMQKMLVTEIRAAIANAGAGAATPVFSQNTKQQRA